MNLWLIFLTGLTTGGLSCAALQGGLLASAIANQQKITKNSNFLPILMFLISKLVIHILLGFLLGLAGSVITLNLGIRLTFQVLTALFMLATAANLLNLHPIFRYVVFQPPRFIQRYIKRFTHHESLFTPLVLGSLTVFIPCGITQAMAVLAINTANPVSGALIMGSFILGTMPIFALIGLATSKLSQIWQKPFAYFTSFVLVGMALYYLNGVYQVIGQPEGVVKSAVIQDPNIIQHADKQEVLIEVVSSGYYPKEFTVKKGIPVELTLKTNGVYSCASAFSFRQFNIFTQLKPVDSQTFTFTPDKPGTFRFSCSMGMYTGLMHVI